MAQPFILKGVVKQDGANVLLPGANVLIAETKQGTSSDASGRFSIQINEKGNYTLKASFIGYTPHEQTISVNSNMEITVNLIAEETVITEVTITNNRIQQALNNPQTGMQKISMKDFKMLPTFMGDSDPIKAIRLTPGVQAGGEGNAGIFVRGGDPGQNLILLEDMPIYNASHLLGLYSVFNPGIVKSVTLYKGAYPTLYGGRASSLLKIGMCDGTTDKAEFEGSIGLISSRGSVRTPLLNKKASLLIGGRITYLQTIKHSAEAINLSSSFLEKNMYNFNDINLRFEYLASSKNRLILNAYTGTDRYNLTHSSVGMTYGMDWGNRAATLKLVHTFNPNCSWSNTLGLTTYFFNLNANYQQYSVKLKSELADLFFRSEVFFKHSKHFIQAGIESTLHTITPESANVNVSNALYRSNIDFRAGEVSLFLNDTYELSPKISIAYGIRGTAYTHLGDYNRYGKDAMGNVADTIKYGYNKPIKTYIGIEPRISANYKQSELSSFKLSISRSYQYMHLISVGSVSLPTDIWFPSTRLVKPEYTDQIALGYLRSIRGNDYEASFDMYFRSLHNIIEFKNSLTTNYRYNEFEESITHGKGYSFGAEWYCRKNAGDLTGWLSYTLAWTLRKFAEINDGKIYYGKYDRRHDLALTLQYQLNKHWSLSSVFIYSTGNAMTLPAGRYMIQGEIINDYTSVNSFRMPAYHRMDISATHTRRVNNKYESNWNISIYNVYNRANPYYVFFEAEGSLEEYRLSVKAKKVALFPILPSVSWSFKF